MNLSDTFYIALCMTVLILGVVYWFWTQNQYIQRKINLLENIVYEMKTALGPPGSSPSDDAPSAHREANPAYPPAPSSVVDDEEAEDAERAEDEESLLHEELHAEATFLPSVPASSASLGSDRLELLPSDHDDVVEAELVPDDLQPGGVGSGLPAAHTEAKGVVLDGMTLKELKRLAEQRGVSGTSAMRKQQLVDALRALPAAPPVVSITPLEGVMDLS